MSKIAISNGLLGGLILVIFNLIIYLIDPLLMANWWLGFLLVPIYFIVLLVIGFNIRKGDGGYITLGRAFINVFVAGLIMSLLGTVYSILLFNVIDPGLGEVLAEELMNRMLDMFARFDLPMEDIEREMEKSMSDIEDQYSAGNLILGFFYSAFGYAIGAIIVAAIVKRNSPEEPATFA